MRYNNDDGNAQLDKKDTFLGLEKQENDLESINTEALRGFLKKSTKDSGLVVPSAV
jgi:hypothetical protein